MINVALPKGRLGETAYETLAAAGYDCPAILEKNRKLTFENLEKGVRYFWQFWFGSPQMARGME